MSNKAGFVLVAVVLLGLLITGSAFLLVAESSRSLVVARAGVAQLQAEAVARAGVLYYQAHGLPPLENGAPKPLRVMADPHAVMTLRLSADGEQLVATGSVAEARSPGSVVTVTAPLWDMSVVERQP